MLSYTLDMEQYDCPFIDTTADEELTFTALHWTFDGTVDRLETRMAVEAADRGALENGLERLRTHDRLLDCRLLGKRDDVALLWTSIPQTDAMGTIRANDGYITGPFVVEGGSERWHVGFDGRTDAEEALTALDRDNEFDVLEREPHDLDRPWDRASTGAAEVREAYRSLSDVERRTLDAAVEVGYFESPRGGTLGDIADEFDVSRAAVSENLRRSQRKLLVPLLRMLREETGGTDV